MPESLTSIDGVVDLSPQEALDSARNFLTRESYRVTQRTDTSLTVERLDPGSLVVRQGVLTQEVLTLVITASAQPEGGVRIQVHGTDRERVRARQAEWTEWSQSLPRKPDQSTTRNGGKTFPIGITAVSTFLTASAALIYALGLVTIWWPLKESYTGGGSTAWYSVSMLPTTVVAGHGLRTLVWPSLTIVVLTVFYWLVLPALRARGVARFNQLRATSSLRQKAKHGAIVAFIVFEFLVAFCVWVIGLLLPARSIDIANHPWAYGGYLVFAFATIGAGILLRNELMFSTDTSYLPESVKSKRLFWGVLLYRSGLLMS